jgi:hypothetical protein
MATVREIEATGRMVIELDRRGNPCRAICTIARYASIDERETFGVAPTGEPIYIASDGYWNARVVIRSYDAEGRAIYP